jgi:pimeloyl-ACP methyl ester carboxylesterase
MSYLTAAGARLEYQWIGPGPDETPTLVFLHEGLGCLRMWRDFPAHLAARTECGALVYSRRGYGGSAALERAHTSRYLHDEASTALPAVLAALEIRRPILIGDSDGASIALLYAGSAPVAAPLGLILEAPHVFVEPITRKGIERMGELFRSTDLARKLARYHDDRTNAVFWNWYDTWLSAEFRSWNIESCLSAITCPLLIVQGEDDEYGTTRQVDAIAAQVSGPAQALVLPACGHTPHRDQPQTVLAAMAKFIRSLV